MKNTARLPSDATVETLRTLIGFPTVSSVSNLDLIDYARAYLEGLGCKTRMTGQASDGKYNLFATLGEGDPDTGLILSGHTDVVPASQGNWTSDPFTLRIAGGRAYGRGTADMKGYIAVCMEQLRDLDPNTLKHPVHLALSFDEEVGCRGVPYLLDDLKARGIRPWGCVIGEPTSMSVVVGHKGSRRVCCTIHGKSAHSSQPLLGVNAIHFGSRLVGFVDQLGTELRVNGPQDADYDVPYSTMLVTQIEGGEALNMVPQRCVLGFGLRHLPDHDPLQVIDEVRKFCEEQLLPDMQAWYPDAKIDFEVMGGVPSFNRSKDSGIIELVASELRALNAGEATFGKVAFGTEAGHFEAHGIPSVVCGPGSISQAHQVDEYVDLSQLAEAETFISGLLKRFCVEGKK
ncbi:MAG TPA: acetylornithine deacetylase [Bordetella sp.]